MTQSKDEIVLARYQKSIDYYWRSSKTNKRAYKLTRSLMVILGAVVTLISALTSSAFLPENSYWPLIFGLAAPVTAATLTIVAGFSQSFQWGSTWQNMVLTAERLEKERDRFMVTDTANRKHEQEMALLNEYVLDESKKFFDRLLGGNPSPPTS